MKVIYGFAPIVLILIIVSFSFFKPTDADRKAVKKTSVVCKSAPPNAQEKTVSIEDYGAKANDANFDNAPVIIKALQSANVILIPAGKVYTIRSAIQVSALSGRTIIAKNATIINRNYDARTFLFDGCSNINMQGGYYTRDVLPTVQNGKEQSTIGFRNCKNVSVINVRIDRSPEMGIDNNIVIGGTYTGNVIEHCLRDGIYAHYSANLKYIGNTLNEIKDDALSMHDYGLDNQKTMLHQAGYSQAGHSVITGNIISNCVQGISSIACTDVTISKNIIKNTVHAGICIFNSEDLYPNSTARVNNIKISDNTISNTGYTVNINGIRLPNYGQIASGRAAIFVACNRQGKAFTTSQMRLANVSVINNTVTNSAVNGATFYNIDGLTVLNNHFTNCHSDTKNAPAYTGDIVEILKCTKINVAGNAVTDTRAVALHNHAYKIDGSSGVAKMGISKGFKISEATVTNSQLH